MSGKGQGNKGGARHFIKPYIDPDIVFSIVSKNQDILCHMGPYEVVSRNNAPDPKGILHCSMFVMDFLDASESGEVHQSSLKKGLNTLLVQQPDVNTTKYSGNVWINLRIERLNCLMYHVRRLAQGTKLHQAAAKLTKNEFKQLQEILQVVKQREAADAAEVEKGTLPLMDIAEKKRSLKKGNSDTSHVSMDASGFPRMFASPSSSSKPLKKASSPLGKGEDPLKKPLKKGKTFPNKPLKKPLTSPKKPLKKGKTSPNKSLKKGNTSPNKSLKKETTSPKKPLGKGLARNSRMRRESLQKAGGSLEKGPKESLTSDLGYKSGSGLKRPAGQALKKATKSLKKEPAGAMTKWFKIKKTVANKPKPRAYLTGSLEEGGKFHLIVEVTHQRSPHYLKVIDTIQEKLEVEHITKEAALALRESLCSN